VREAPTPEEEDRRRLCRERKVLIVVRHVNRVKGLTQGISGYEPLRCDRRQRPDMLSSRMVSSS
jgi:transposase